jgi:hypothetical protein
MKEEPWRILTMHRFTTPRVFETIWQTVGFTRMEHPPYSPDPAPCDSFLFGAMKRNSSGQHFESVEGTLLALEAFLGGLSADFLQTVLLEWERQLQACCESGQEYTE